MSAFDRTAVRAYLEGMTGEALPEWGTCFSTDGTDGPTGIGPVCRDEDHEEADGSVYDCCPSPVIEAQSTELAEYLAALLNADREKGTREGESTPQPAELTVYRASHESIVMGLYITHEAARAHCMALLLREDGDRETFGWVPDDGGELAAEELCTGYDVECTGYVVTPLLVASEYDEEADE